MGESTLLQYVDDILLCSPLKEILVLATTSLLNFLADMGYWVSPAKAQPSLSQVTYLRLALTPTTRALTADRVAAIKALLPPTSGAEILSFLGLVGFFRHWVLNFALLARPLYAAATETPTGLLTSPTKVASAFNQLQDALLSSPPLMLPDLTKPFTLYTAEREGVATGVLVQPVRPGYHPVAFLSS